MTGDKTKAQSNKQVPEILARCAVPYTHSLQQVSLPKMHAHARFIMDDQVIERMKKKYDICYVMAKEGLAFRKYPPALHDFRHSL